MALRFGHLWTTMSFLIYAAVWLVPWAWFATLSSWPYQILALFVSSLPMAYLCWRFRAGFAEVDQNPS